MHFFVRFWRTRLRQYGIPVLLLCHCVFAIGDDPRPALIGWATVAGGTTGGDGGTVTDVTDAAQLQRAVAVAGPKVILVRGTIGLTKPLRLTSDTTLRGGSGGGRLEGGGLFIRKVRNIVIQNLSISDAADAVSIEESDHVWVDHCVLSRCSDGLLDIKRGSDFITVSRNLFRDHHKTCLLGHSDKPEIREIDRGHLRVTYHHNFFDGTKTRHPRVRFADGVHVFNNYFRNNEYGVASLMDAGVIVEANVFEKVEMPTVTSYGDSPDPGRLTSRNNLLINSGPIQTRGNVDVSVLQYSYTTDPVGSLRESVSRNAGLLPDGSPAP